MKPTDQPTNGTHVPTSLGAFNTAQEVPPLPKTKPRRTKPVETTEPWLDPPAELPLPASSRSSGAAAASIPLRRHHAASIAPPLPGSVAYIEAYGAEQERTPATTKELIVEECRALEALLLEKNEAYGDSALNPLRLFSHASPIEQLKVRIDDKLSRIARGDFAKVKEEDLRVVTKDLLGYLILIRVGWRLGLE